MAAFYGTESRTIDDKQRLPLPSLFRDQLGAEHGVVTRMGGVLAMYAADDFQELIDRLHTQVQADEKPKALLQRITGNAYPVRPDAQNRIKIPKQILKDDELRGELFMVGTNKRIEIRPPARHEAYLAEIAAATDEDEDYL